MNIFQEVKGLVTARQIAEFYGLKVGRNGMACCPFHPDRHPSLKLDKNYHCFGCGVQGDAIDYTSRMFGLTQWEAAEKLAVDLNLPIHTSQTGTFAPATKRNRRVKKKTAVSNLPLVRQEQMQETERLQKVKEKLEKWTMYTTDVLIRYLKWIEFWKEFYKPDPEDADWHELFVEALGNEAKINFYLDILMFGDGEEIADFTEQVEGR